MLRCPAILPAMRVAASIVISALWLAAGQSATSSERAAYTSSAPPWLRAVGQLTVPGYETVDGERRHREENCSASLVGPETVLTAWHCFEFYRDLSRDALFTLPLAPRPRQVAARRLTDGGGMSADWALLRLQQPIEDVTPIPVGRYRNTLDSATLVLAGFARDQWLGDGGRNLTWEANCRQTANERYRVGTDCVTFKGASGGAVVSEGKLVGVISAGDGEGVTYFAPSSLFMLNLRLHHR